MVRAPGIGKKTAQRIILELKDKIDVGELTNSEDDIDNINATQNTSEVLEALIALGYSEKEGNKALASIDKTKESSTEDMIKKALKFLMN